MLSFRHTKQISKNVVDTTFKHCNNIPFFTAKFYQNCIWTFPVKAWQPQTSLNTFYFFLWYDPHLSQNLIFLSVWTFIFWFTTSKTMDLPIFIPTGIQCKYLQPQKQVTIDIARDWPMLWNPQNRLNSIGHISKTILIWLKQLGKLHTQM